MVAILVFLSVLGAAGPAPALPSLADSTAFVTNGPVNAITQAGGLTFIGGRFTQVGPRTGSGVAFATSNGQRRSGWSADVTGGGNSSLPLPGAPVPASNSAPPTPPFGSRVTAVVADGAGGFYIGGAFTEVGGLVRDGLAHIRADGSVDPAFDPPVHGVVQALAVFGSKLIVGGAFDAIGGVARVNLAMLDSTGHVSAFDPAPDRTVEALGVSGGTLYVGGEFTHIAGQVRNYMAAFGATGSLTAFDPDLNGDVFAISTESSTIYIGGLFTAVGPTARAHLAALAGSGAPTTFNPAPNGPVFALAPHGSTLYVGGHFSQISGMPHSNLAAVRPDGSAEAAPSADNAVYGLAGSASTVYVAGLFTHLGSTARNGVAGIDAAAGTVNPFNPNANAGALAVALSGPTLYVGGDFTSVGGSVRENIAALRPDGTLAAPDVRADGEVVALASSGSAVYAGGAFTHVAGQSRSHLTAFSPTTGTLTSFDPGVDGPVTALVSANGLLYVGGTFGIVAGQPRANLAALDAAGNPTPFNPGADGPVSAVASSGFRIYVGGTFLAIGGQPRTGVAELDPGGAPTSFDPKVMASGETCSPPCGTPLNPFSVNALALAGSSLYVGGHFDFVDGRPRRNLAKFNLSTGVLMPLRADADADVSALAVSGPDLYVGGTFNLVAGQPRNALAAIDVGTGQLTSFDPNLHGGTNLLNDEAGSVRALLAEGASLYAGGEFSAVGGQTAGDFVQFSPPAPLSPPPAITEFRMTRRSFRVGRSSTATVARQTPAGTRFDYTLSERSNVTIDIERRRHGVELRQHTTRRWTCISASRRALDQARREVSASAGIRRLRGGIRARAIARALAGRACLVYTQSATITRRVQGPGRASLAFSGRIGRRPLAPGRYRAVAEATNRLGRSAPRSAYFMVSRD